MTGTLSAALLALAAEGAGPVPADDGFVADLDPAVVETLPADRRNPRTILDAALANGTAFRFDTGLVSAWTDTRWYGVVSTTDSGSGARPILEIRRWPGDTILAFYALPTGTDDPSIPGARWDPGRTGPSGWSLRSGALEADGLARRIVWAERTVGESLGRCGALLVPGDAGLGASSPEQREEELLAILETVALPEEAWRVAQVPSGPGIALPILPDPSRPWDEGRDPWQPVEGPGYTIGLPPGIRARRLDTGVTSASATPGAGLWFRGRFVDRDGVSVVIGDGRRAGYVVDRKEGLATWRGGGQRPAGIAKGDLQDTVPLERVAIEGTGARAGWVSRWTEPGFQGSWIVFGLDFGDRGVEVGVPVVAGRRSLALFWIPVTWRDASRPPAPPPIDPASRFGIRFDRTTRLDRSHRGEIEGTLEAPGIRMELPLGWWPSATLRSRDGFPLLLIDETGEEVARIDRVPSGGVTEILAEGGWTAQEGARSRGATEILATPGGARVFRAKEGHAWRLTPLASGRPGWDRLVSSVTLRAIPASKAN